MNIDNFDLISDSYVPTFNRFNRNQTTHSSSPKKIFRKPVMAWLGGQAAIVGLTIGAIAVKSHLPAE